MTIHEKRVTLGELVDEYGAKICGLFNETKMPQNDIVAFALVHVILAMTTKEAQQETGGILLVEDVQTYIRYATGTLSDEELPAWRRRMEVLAENLGTATKMQATKEMLEHMAQCAHGQPGVMH